MSFYESGHEMKHHLKCAQLKCAYNLCNTTKNFRVLRIGTSIRVNKQSFDNWFAAV